MRSAMRFGVLILWNIFAFMGTAFAIADRHFLTAAHVLVEIVESGDNAVVLEQVNPGDPKQDNRSIRANLSRAVISVVHDIALISTSRFAVSLIVLTDRGVDAPERGPSALEWCGLSRRKRGMARH